MILGALGCLRGIFAVFPEGDSLSSVEASMRKNTAIKVGNMMGEYLIVGTPA